MIYRVVHRTTYAYDDPVAFTRCVLRLTPATTDAQTVLDHAIAVIPSPVETRRRLGPFDEQTLTMMVDKPHRSLVIEARSRVDVHAPPLVDPDAGPGWESVRAHALEAGDLGARSPASFLYPTQRTPILPRISEFARASFPAGRPIVAAAADLMRRIKADFKYDPEATDVRTTSGEAFDARGGVCQDFAHVMIAGLRGLGLPAAYVSGYLRTTPPPGRPRLEGADATHAWVSVWCGLGTGWIGFDPTNAIFVQGDHITLAMGRDYADVAPIDGVVLGSGEQALKVEVDVIPEDELRAFRPPTAVQPAVVGASGAPRPR